MRETKNPKQTIRVRMTEDMKRRLTKWKLGNVGLSLKTIFRLFKDDAPSGPGDKGGDYASDPAFKIASQLEPPYLNFFDDYPAFKRHLMGKKDVPWPTEAKGKTATFTKPSGGSMPTP